MKPVLVYSTRICPYCMLAKRLLTGKGVAFDEVMVDRDDNLRAEMMERSGRRTVPQIFVGDTHVGGFDDLAALDRAGKLDPLLRDA
ncbi:glutaredoxin 3 [Nevskia sp.]|uniref:glutaredoxin 3 n=1 Tax=Nevskia sp. TaxID=1929292 RepID=UPI0025F78263|nr:glutaredoxin 3 [Nevskia sp.]